MISESSIAIVSLEYRLDHIPANRGTLTTQ